jgi:hypothetical protein
MQESREIVAQETTRFFPVVSRSWRFPIIHVGALTKSIAPAQVTKTQVLTKSTHSTSKNGGSRTVCTKLSWGSHNLQELTKKPQSTKTI